MKSILELLKEKILLGDGALGTMLQKHGLSLGECPEYWNITKADIVTDIHLEYIDAGADIILTNTFGANKIKLSKFNLEGKIKEINVNAVKNARKVAKDNVFIAGNLGPTGSLLEPLGDLTSEEVYNVFKEQVLCLIEGGVDLIIIETMISIEEVVLATKAAKENSDLPVASLMTFEVNKNGIKTVMGVDVKTMVEELEKGGADIIGTNCGSGIKNMIEVVKAIKKETNKFIMAEPNAGLPVLKNGVVVYDGTPEVMSSYIPHLIDAGTNIIGGCCGTTPQHIKSMREKIIVCPPNAGNYC
ncbi:MAG: homocysteine S-methyltransferase family protein [Candidatus Firestonebacteria bacterium]